MKTLKVLSILLSYPTEAFQTEAGTLKAVLDEEGVLAKRDTKILKALIGELAEDDLMDVQERYVHLFDRTRSLSLHLFEHVHGESRDRGQAMVDLMGLYQKHGLEISARELPDYLPIFLEFLSILPERQARELFAEPLPVLGAIKARLEERESPYATVFDALEKIAGGKSRRDAVETILEAAGDDDPDDMETIDKAWEEKEVRFGPDATGGTCPKAAEMLKRMDVPEGQSVRGEK